MTKIIFMGTPDFSTTVLEMLIAEHDVIAVVTQPDRPVGRKRVMTPPPVKKVAMKYDLPVYQPEKIKWIRRIRTIASIRCRFNCNCCFWTIIT
ncbi:Methionyl-tRNA formyltransferase [Staphylococcus aureus]|uniref:Methionyl-tRNA formyltransferase n=1 Tax=Staphylococcus aureus TaxID=1280 RepID=A0A380DRJ1_STAAU|nr:Methionyl-tRNA formyltransferase [Staphylococcus aureus]